MLSKSSQRLSTSRHDCHPSFTPKPNLTALSRTSLLVNDPHPRTLGAHDCVTARPAPPRPSNFIWFIQGVDSLLCALSDGSRLRTTRRWAAAAGPESTSWITIRMASASTEAWRRGAASRSSSAGTGLGVGIARNPAISGLEEDKRKWSFKNGFASTQK